MSTAKIMLLIVSNDLVQTDVVSRINQESHPIMNVMCRRSLKFDNECKEEKEETKRGTALSASRVGL